MDMSKFSEYKGTDLLKHVVEYIRLAVSVFLKNVRMRSDKHNWKKRDIV